MKVFKDLYKLGYKINPIDMPIDVKVGSLVREPNSLSLNKDEIVSAITRYNFERNIHSTVPCFSSNITLDVSIVGIYHKSIARHIDVVEGAHDIKLFVCRYKYIEEFDRHSYINKTYSLAEKASQDHSIIPRVYRVVVDSDSVCTPVHKTFGNTSKRDLVCSSDSVLKNRLGLHIASEYIAIVNNCIVDGGTQFHIMTKALKTSTYIVKNDVLVGYLHSVASDIRLGQSITENSRAEDLFPPPMARQTYIYCQEIQKLRSYLRM